MGIEHKTKAFFAAISQWGGNFSKKSDHRGIVDVVGQHDTDANLDQRNEENFDRSYYQVKARVGYVST